MKKIGTVNYRNLFEIRVFFGRDGERYVGLKEMAEAIGLEPTTFTRRTDRNDPEGASMMSVPSAGGRHDTRVVDIRDVPGLIFGMDANLAKENG